mgnify:CR=1 FL=1
MGVTRDDGRYNDPDRCFSNKGPLDDHIHKKKKLQWIKSIKYNAFTYDIAPSNETYDR